MVRYNFLSGDVSPVLTLGEKMSRVLPGSSAGLAVLSGAKMPGHRRKVWVGVTR